MGLERPVHRLPVQKSSGGSSARCGWVPGVADGETARGESIWVRLPRREPNSDEEYPTKHGYEITAAAAFIL
jgi:hypothetical protein